MSEPVTLAEMREHLGIVQSSDITRDSVITSRIRSAREMSEVYTDTIIVMSNMLCSGRKFPDFDKDKRIMLSIPLQSVTSITYVDSNNVTQTISPTDYDVDTIMGYVEPAFGKSWPAALDKANSVQINYVAGYSNVSESIKEAIRFIVAQWEIFQSSIEGVLRPMTIPNAAKQLLESSSDYRDEFKLFDFKSVRISYINTVDQNALYDSSNSILTDIDNSILVAA